MDLAQVIAQRMRRAMDDAGIDRCELRRRVGCSYQAVDAWFTGHRAPTAAKLVGICKALGVTADYLLGLED